MTALQSICKHFGVDDILSAEPLSNGLINSSYKVQAQDGQLYFLQQVNTAIFKVPLALQTNYGQIDSYLSARHEMHLPQLIKTIHGELLYGHENEVWRCFAFVPGTFSPLTVDTPEQAYDVANCFGAFTAALHDFDNNRLEIVIPRFHDLSFRHEEFQAALQKASRERIYSVKELIEQTEEHNYLVDWFQKIASDKKVFPQHVMHHDCKVSNILFDKKTGDVLCPIDLDTTQPGLFFSDIGDMIRTMTPNKSEDEKDVNAITVRPAFLKAITDGYTDAMRGCLTPEETEGLHRSGMLMTYMQAMRFLTDYLNGNVYYKTEYPEQNKDRTANQLRLLQLLAKHAEQVVVQ